MLNYKQRVMEDLDALLADLQSTTAHISSFQQQQAEQEQYQNRRPDIAHGCPSLKQHIVQENSTHHHHHHHLHHHQQQQQQQQHHHSYSSERTSSSSSNSGATYHQERSSASSTLSQSSLPGLSPVGYNKPIGSGSVSSGSNSSLGANASSQMSSTINSNLSELDQLLQDLNSAHFLDEVNRRTNSNQSQFVNGNSQRVVTSPGQVPSSTGSQPVQPPVAPKPNRVETNNRANVDAMLHELDHGVPPPPAGASVGALPPLNVTLPPLTKAYGEPITPPFPVPPTGPGNFYEDALYDDPQEFKSSANTTVVTGSSSSASSSNAGAQMMSNRGHSVPDSQRRFVHESSPIPVIVISEPASVSEETGHRQPPLPSPPLPMPPSYSASVGEDPYEDPRQTGATTQMSSTTSSKTSCHRPSPLLPHSPIVSDGAPHPPLGPEEVVPLSSRTIDTYAAAMFQSRQMAGVNSAATTVGQHAQIGGQVYGQNATYIQQPLYQETPMMSPQTASTATRELDELMASLSEFRVSNRDNSVAQQVAGGDPAYARPHKIRNESAGTATSAATSSMSATSMTAKGDQLDSMLGSLQSDMNRQGVSTKTKGLCAACNKPVVSQMITALGKVWHVEHFTCAHCTMTLGTMSFYERDNKAYCEKDYHSLFAPRCAYCNGPIVDKCVTALDKTWHPEHFFCGLCGRNFGDEGFHERDGQAYCREDFLKMFAPKCGGCAQPIKDSYISALNRHWHPDCFVCWQCQVPFGNTSFFDHDGLPYCEQHYHAKRGSLCSDCQQPITGPSIIAMGRKFHPKHFTCAFCRKQLNNVTFKEQNEKPYCHPCFSKLFAGTKMMD
ncbi:transforming growth factor beta-1-induced transcript 1 protein isoform X2 [Octopus sinensis]|uniref:Transforming growth factor beta-1-induced transcript 1 protein isoform X2 n=1 Tax=Octopus sinensis TaxID=2607531 RepID=A0A7E6FN31_9MOLL|nr:transforming growth factor beta-1-induced transcript 1 protein isoform X2 [Octopus sinensis]